MINIAKLLLLTACCFLFGGATLCADTYTVADESDHIYGQGVHTFFDRDYEEAVTILLQIEDIKSNDPRPYYFLGLAYLRQKKTEEADQYFKKAAQLEYSGRALRDYGVSEALRRIQGEERLRIEKIRSEERTNARIREQQLREARYGSENAAGRTAIRQLAPQTQKEDLAVLQGMAGTPVDNAFGVREMNPIAAEEEVAVRRVDANPFGGGGTVEAEKDEDSVMPELILPVMRPPTPPASPTRTTAVPSAGRDRRNPPEAVPAGVNLMAAPTQGTKEVAREIGRGLGTLFSRKTSGK